MSLWMNVVWAQDVVAAPAVAGSVGSLLVSYGPLVAMVALMYFLVLRPQFRQAREHERLVKALAKGDDVLVGAVLGRIVAVRDSVVDVMVADGVVLTVLKEAVTRPLTAPEKALLKVKK